MKKENRKGKTKGKEKQEKCLHVCIVSQMKIWTKKGCDRGDGKSMKQRKKAKEIAEAAQRAREAIEKAI